MTRTLENSENTATDWEEPWGPAYFSPFVSHEERPRLVLGYCVTLIHICRMSIVSCPWTEPLAPQRWSTSSWTELLALPRCFSHSLDWTTCTSKVVKPVPRNFNLHNSFPWMFMDFHDLHCFFAGFSWRLGTAGVVQLYICLALITTFLPCLVSGGLRIPSVLVFAGESMGRSREPATMQTSISLVVARWSQNVF